MNVIIPDLGEDLKSLARKCDGLYICPKGTDGKRRGPMVSYAGKDEKDRNLIGDIYLNFRRIEQWTLVVDSFAERIYDKLRVSGAISEFDTICGIPEGGRTLGQALARMSRKRFVYATKVPKPTEPGRKQEYRWDLSQFDFFSGERLLLMEDVINNLQNTDNTLAQIPAGAKVAFLGAALNRSPFADREYVPKAGAGVYAGMSLPIVCAIREPYPEYAQDDAEVAADVAAGNVEFEVKKNWAKLMAAMDAHEKATGPD